jgi:hypothetical protein
LSAHAVELSARGQGLDLFGLAIYAAANGVSFDHIFNSPLWDFLEALQ